MGNRHFPVDVLTAFDDTGQSCDLRVHLASVRIGAAQPADSGGVSTAAKSKLWAINPGPIRIDGVARIGLLGVDSSGVSLALRGPTTEVRFRKGRKQPNSNIPRAIWMSLVGGAMGVK